MVSTIFTAVSRPVSIRSVYGQYGKAKLSVCLIRMLDDGPNRSQAPPPPVCLFDRASDVCFFGALFSFPNNPAPRKRRKPSECLDHVAVRRAETPKGF